MTPDLRTLLFDVSEQRFAKINENLLNLTDRNLRILKYCAILEKRQKKLDQKINLLYQAVRYNSEVDFELRQKTKQVTQKFIKQESNIRKVENLMQGLKLK